MKRLQELRSLVDLARKFGQTPAADILEQLSQLEAQEQRRLQREAAIRERIATDITEMFQHAPVIAQPVVEATVVAEPAPLEIKIKPNTVDLVAQAIAESTVAPEPVLAQPHKDLTQEIKYLREWIGRIAATGPGGGAGDIINLDAPVTLVTTSSYTIGRRDYYIGVNVSTSTTVVLPGTNTKAGRSLVIKDESGRCSVNPITISGTIDNDTSGAILAIDNGALHLIYRQGWRIV